MSDMEVREIKTGLTPQVLESKLTVSDVRDTDPDKAIEALVSTLKKPAGKKRTYTDGGVTFEGPSEAEQRQLAKEKASPLVDAAGRHRWIVSRECWCSTSGDECRLHSKSEPGWETCPSEARSGGRQPRQLWATNPDFGKPRNVEDVLAEEVVEKVE